MLVVAACGKKPDATTDKPEGPGSGVPVGGAVLKPIDPSAEPCQAGVERLFAIIKATGTAEEKAANTPELMTGQIAACKGQPWPAALVKCIGTIDSVPGYMSKCYKAAFTGDIELKTIRQLDAAVDTSRIKPSVFEIEGDFVVFNKAKRCGLISKKLPPVEGVLAICGGKVIAGPLTTPEEVEAVAVVMRVEMADGDQLMMKVQQQFPPSCASCRYTVRDAKGDIVPQP